MQLLESYGNNFARWSFPSGHAFRTLADTVSPNERVILALTVPSPITDVESSSSLTGDLEGSVDSDAAVFENAAASLDGALSGSVSADAVVDVITSSSITGNLSGSIDENARVLKLLDEDNWTVYLGMKLYLYCSLMLETQATLMTKTVEFGIDQVNILIHHLQSVLF